MNKLVVLGLGALVAFSSVTGARAQMVARAIDLVTDSACTSADLCLNDSLTTTLQVAIVEAYDADGAEFRIVGLPPGWTTQVTPSPNVLLLGDPFGNGANVGIWPWVSGCARILNVVLRLPHPGASATLSIVAHAIPANPNYVCPNVTHPVLDGRTCVSGGSLTINGSGCTVGVAPIDWGRAKRLYE